MIVGFDDVRVLDRFELFARILWVQSVRVGARGKEEGLGC